MPGSLITAVVCCTSCFECCLLLTTVFFIEKFTTLALATIGNHKLSVTNIQYLCYRLIKLKKLCSKVRTCNVCFWKDRRHCCHHTCSCQIHTLTSTPLIRQPVCKLPLQQVPSTSTTDRLLFMNLVWTSCYRWQTCMHILNPYSAVPPDVCSTIPVWIR